MLALLLVMILVAGGAIVPAVQASPFESGETVARHLQKRFDETMSDCGSPTRPAFLCSGILMRSTKYSAGYHSWIPNPASAPWGVSFSWLRQDSNFNVNYPSGNGFVIYPHFYADDGNYELLKVRCAYANDAGTGAPDRCNSTGIPPVCRKLGVTTAEQWVARFAGGRDQCAFEVTQGIPSTAFAWMQMVKVRQIKTFITHNEIILAAWPQTTYARMPIEAFFYRTNANGLASARLDQQDFKKMAGRWVPIIRWTPTIGSARATFTYNVADQAIWQ
ncbi:hypothetical protein ACQKIE_01625 [Luteibacter sp. NPDC031894]|uniref:hypothetical protein n=1 Tax=Luteibacter sp. NPDC031894 TaxID=3390572 RepID=UPI003D092895